MILLSINSNMKSLILQENKEVIKPSGARKKEWIDIEELILIAIYETDNRVNTSNAIYNSSTHIGLTFNKSITSKNRLKDGDRIYNITGVNSQGRLNQVFLKVIENV
ncbi:head-tail adaptor protein [Clostridium perfringens]|uniref:head-tail adaptor protein n=1 Tax=Clostridium perfringens TaxID=1502 RepID=UPI0024BC32B8|nr:head-tail adaptor protein [Clostridium perfringens]